MSLSEASDVIVVVPFILSVASVYAIAVTSLLVIRKISSGRRLLAWVAGALYAACPLLIPADEVIARALASVLCTDAWFRGVDLARVLSRNRPSSPTLWQCFEFLIPFPLFVVVFDDRKRSESRKIAAVDLWRIVIAGSLAVFEIWMLVQLFEVVALKSSFVLDHVVKLLLFMATTQTLSYLALGIEHLAGFDTGPIIRWALVSRTVGEFWCRYNTRVHRWLQYNVFVPCGGLKSPVRGIVLTFFVSALFHELMFGIATSRFDGYQFTFFMIQAPAVLMSQAIEGLRPKYGAIISAFNHLITIAWFSVTSTLFFHGVDRVFHYVYASQSWLP